MTSLKELNQKQNSAQQQLQAQLRELDHMNLNADNLSTTEVKNWYEQHLLVLVLRQFRAKNEVVLPRHLARFEVCFSNEPQILALYPALLKVHNVDQLVLRDGFMDLKRNMELQGLHIAVTTEFNQWRLRLETVVE